MIDPSIFANVVFCLLDNVPKYADSGSVVNVEWSAQANGRSRLSVCTLGQRIRDEDDQRIYRKFGQGKSGVAGRGGRGEGSGLGLWVTSELLRLIGGSIGHEKRERFTTFRADFPHGRVARARVCHRRRTADAPAMEADVAAG
jgi:K+-sensing histidine kinase KdpD